jgi:hypothetical protein
MTEREIPAFSGFHSGGKTNAATPTFAPSAVSEPEFLMNTNSSNPVPMTRREMRAAGLYNIESDDAGSDAAAPVISIAPAEPTPVELAPAALIPLVEPAALVAHPVTESTLAMQVTEIEAELAATVSPLVVHQAPITAIAPAVAAAAAPLLPVSTVPSSSVPPVPAPSAPTARELEQLDVATIFGLAASTDVVVDVTAAATSRRGLRGAPVNSQTRHPRETRATRATRKRAARPAPQPAAVRAASDRKSIRQRATGFGVMVLVGGLFAVLALPAYADNNASSLTSASAVRTQKLTVSDAAATDSM